MMDMLRPSGPKKNHKKGISSQAKERLRAEAKDRQSEYDKLTIEEKIGKLDLGGYVAKKQRAKLEYQLIIKKTAQKVKESKV